MFNLFYRNSLFLSGSGGGAPSEFSPADIASLQFWVDGGSGRVDLSSNARTVINSGSTISTSVLNGHDVFEFNGSSDMKTAESFSGANPRTYIAVYKADVAGTNPICGTSYNQVAGTWDVLQARALGDPYAAGYQRDLGQDAPDQAWKYAQVDYDGTTRNLYKNGVLNDTEAQSLNTVSGQEFIMGRDADNAFLTGKIAACYVFDEVLSAIDNASMNTYIEARFNL